MRVIYVLAPEDLPKVRQIGGFMVNAEAGHHLPGVVVSPQDAQIVSDQQPVGIKCATTGVNDVYFHQKHLAPLSDAGQYIPTQGRYHPI
jgi:hypothetical protein